MAASVDVLLSKNRKSPNGADGSPNSVESDSDANYELSNNGGESVNGSSDRLDNRNGSVSPAVPHEVQASTPRRLSSSSEGGHHSPYRRPNSLPVTPRTGNKSANTSQTSKKKGSNWFSLASYKQKADEFHRLFKDIPSEERLLVDYSCAIQKDLLVHGRMYITQNWICFYANIFKWETTVMIPCKDIKSVTKEKTAKVIPNAIQINTSTEKYFFSSFASRDKTYLMLFRVWQNALIEQPMTNQMLWRCVHRLYGGELGLTASDDDYEIPEDEADTPGIESMNATSRETIPSGSPKSTAKMSRSQSGSADRMAKSRQIHNVSTGYSDTTEDEEDVEVTCPENHEHGGWCSLDLELNFSVDQLFELIFSDSAFFVKFLESQKTTDLNLGTWTEQPDEEGRRHRNNTYTVAINASFGPKTTPASEHQHMSKDCKPGSYYCIDADQINDPSLPYGENFQVWNRYCICRLANNRSRVKVHTQIVYKKSVFSLVKSIIEKTVKNGVAGYYKPLAEVLAAESNKVAGPIDQKKKRYTRHRTASNHRAGTRQTNGTVPNKLKTNHQPTSTEQDSARKSAHITSTVRVMSALLIFLVMFNMLLFCKLWALETQQNIVQIHSNERDYYTPKDLVELLNKQKAMYEKDFKQWQTTLLSSTAMIDELKHSIEEIRSQQLPTARIKEASSADRLRDDL